ncbi:hypothetical protein GCM10027289_00340 [Tsukamurella serpentis]
MSFEVDPDSWERTARGLERLAADLPPVNALAFPDDRYAAALGTVPVESDRIARELHREAVGELERLAMRIRGQARSTVRADSDGARAIEAAS